MKRTAALIVVGPMIAAAAGLQGCAAIAHGSMQNISVASTPSQAQVFVNGEVKGKTPMAVRLKRMEKNQKIRIELAGYKPYEVTLARKIDGWFWGDIILLSTLGVIVDATTGSMYRLTPAAIDAKLSAGTADIRNEKDDLSIRVVLHADPRWERIGRLEPAP
jgi:hypothetical protein